MYENDPNSIAAIKLDHIRSHVNDPESWSPLFKLNKGHKVKGLALIKTPAGSRELTPHLLFALPPEQSLNLGLKQTQILLP